MRSFWANELNEIRKHAIVNNVVFFITYFTLRVVVSLLLAVGPAVLVFIARPAQPSAQ
jgi:hypothetical protein